MIEFYSENDFKLPNNDKTRDWITSVVHTEGFELGDISYVFCSDKYLLELNKEYLGHDTLTDILSFDYSLGRQLNGEIYISSERVAENAAEMKLSFEVELHRVIIHGVLHYCGYKDGSIEDKRFMRSLEDKYLGLIEL